jgi:thymidylate synthase (FAD)
MHSVTLTHTTTDGEDLIAYMARVSNPDNQNNTETSARLIKYLIKHKHWSPLEMVSMCVEINTTRSIAQQIIRHRSFSFQEFSQRYTTALGKPVINELRLQDHSNRQNSIEGIHPIDQQHFEILLKQHYDQGQLLYAEMLKAGVAKECAREVLPLSTPTRLYMHGSIRSWVHYCDLRCGNGTQKEHKIIADQCKDLLEIYYPAVYEAAFD